MKSIQTYLLSVFLAALIFQFNCASTAKKTKPAVTQKPTEIKLTQMVAPETLPQYDAYVKENAPGEDAFVAVQRIAAPYIASRQWEKAVEIFNTYRPLFKTLDMRFKKIIDLLMADEENLVITNLGGTINTTSSEYQPTPTANGTSLYFTAKDRTDGLGGEDIYFAELKADQWQPAENLGSQINTKSHEFICSISADGNRLILFGNYDESFGRGDLFYTDKTKEGWSTVQHFPGPINTEYFECNGLMSSDGKALLFTSDRPGGIGEFHKKDDYFHGAYGGNIDIYVCLRTETGWSDPINLGPQINTPYCEYTPFLHPDGKTLYFSSDGHYGLGNFDVFKAVRLSEESWTEWSEPVNLGKEINTVDNDWGYKIGTSGNIAYFSAYSKAGGFGRGDLYSITLPDLLRPKLVATIKGTVTDNAGHPIEADIKWEDLSTGKNVGQLKSNPQDGGYFIALPLGKKYGYYASKAGYYPVSQNIDLQNENTVLNITEDILLLSIAEIKEKEIIVRINNIFFEYDKFDLLPESHSELNRLAEILKENQEAKVEIAGHTDDKGTTAYNKTLSEKRAQAVIEYLVAAGCAQNSLIARGFGESKPVATNETEKGRALNRRVEFRYLKDVVIKR